MSSNGGYVFIYSRIPKSREVVIPGTFGRYRLTLDGLVYDRFLDKLIDPINRHYVLELPWHRLPIHVTKLIAVCFKGWHAPLEFVSRCEILFSDGDEDNIHPRNLIWKFPEEGLEVPTFPGYYFIPSFTCYAINNELKVISLFEGSAKLTSLATTGYRDLGLRRDDGTYVGTNLHRVAALTFIDYDNTINEKVVNHIDGDRDNTALDNLEWVTQSENVLHGNAIKTGYIGSAKNTAIMRMLKNRGVNTDGIVLEHDGIEIKNIVTGEIKKYDSQKKASEAIGVSVGTISLKVSGHAIYPVIMDKYIVRRVGSEWPTWDESIEYSQAKNKTTLVKNVETGEILKYKSAKQAYLDLGLSKKVVTSKLKKKDRRPINGFIFKYENDPDDF